MTNPIWTVEDQRRLRARERGRALHGEFAPAPSRPTYCSRCQMPFSEPIDDRAWGLCCPVCLRPLTRSTKKRFRRGTRKTNPKPLYVAPIFKNFDRPDPGSPLGKGMPSGSTLREDGDSHREGWMRVIRRDPCSFCGAEGGTVDHIEPQSRPARGIGGAHSWINYAGACESCNQKKGAMPLLEFLGRRAGVGFADPAWKARQMGRLAA